MGVSEPGGGTGAELLLLPGLLCDATVWADQVAALPGLRCTVPDYGTHDSITAMAEHALTQVRAPSFALAGHSMGGRVALEIMRLAPQRVERLALLDTGLDPLPPGEAGAAERAGRMALLAKARAEGMRAMGRQWARGMVHPDRLDSPLFERILDMIERKTPDIFEAQLRALLDRPDARPVWQAARAEALLLVGRDDTWSPLARHEQMQALRPDSRLVVVDRCGHMSTMEQPDAVTQALRAWLGLPATMARH